MTVTTSTRPICLWSGPRNVSTALMYSFAQLPGIRVVDEPLYGHYLRVTGAAHPGRRDVLAAMDCDGDAVMRGLVRRQRQAPLPRLFLKQMAHHLVDLDLAFLDSTENIFLIRNPRDMLPSLTVQLPDAGPADTGLQQQWRLFRRLRRRAGQPLVLDAQELLSDPRAVLSELCRAIGVEYSDTMLSWPAGPRPEDGVWAPHWYEAVHRSTGFQPYRARPDFPDSLRPLLARCEPWYRQLYEHALRAP